MAGPDMSMFANPGGSPAAGAGPDMSMFGSAPAPHSSGPDMSMFGSAPTPQSGKPNYTQTDPDYKAFKARQAQPIWNLPGNLLNDIGEAYHQGEQEYNDATAKESAAYGKGNFGEGLKQTGRRLESVVNGVGAVAAPWTNAVYRGRYMEEIEHGQTPDQARGTATVWAGDMGLPDAGMVPHSMVPKPAVHPAVSTAAATVMDAASDAKATADVQGNLRAATNGTGQPSDFVTGLFKKRGMDTTPQSDPRGNTSPTTGDTVTLSPEEQVQLRQLAKTGSVDDIKSFFSTKQGPKPTWQQVDQMVDMRDNYPQNAVGADNMTQALNEQISTHQHQLVSDHVAAQTANWKNAPDIEVTHSPETIEDPTIRAEVMKNDPNGNALGIYGSDGKARIFSSRIDSPELANSVLYHEALGHHGLSQQFGAGLDSTLNTLVTRNVGKFGDRVRARMDATGESQALAAEEVLAMDSQKGPLKPALKDAISAKLNQFGRRMGLKLAYSDNEIQHILAMSHDAVINGSGRDVRANGFRGTVEHGSAPNSQWLNMSGEPTTEPAKFMYGGRKATGFDPNNPRNFEGDDGHPRYEISDYGVRYNKDGAPNPGEPGKLSDVLIHPELYKQYPELANMPVHTGPLNMTHGYEGMYLPKTRSIMYDPNGLGAPLYTLLHEAQHAVQHIEGHSNGGAGDLPYDQYHRVSGEVEARDTEARAGMTDEQRAQVEPYSSQKIPKDQRIVSPPVVDRLAAKPTDGSKFMTRDQASTPGMKGERSLLDTYENFSKLQAPEEVPWEDQQGRAMTLGFTTAKIRGMKDSDLSNQLYRMGSAVNMLGGKLADLRTRIGTAEERPTDQLEFTKAIAEHLYLAQRFLDNKSEAGRALQVVKAFSDYTHSGVEAMGELIRSQGDTLAGLSDRETFLKFARNVGDLLDTKNVDGVNTAVTQLSKPYWGQYLLTYGYNAMLSSLATPIKKIGNDLSAIVRDQITTTMGLGVSKVRGLIPGQTDIMHSSEVFGSAYGTLRAALDHSTYRNTADAFLHGSGDQSESAPQAINSPDIPLKVNGFPILSTPSRALHAIGTFFRSFMETRAMYQIGAREAVKQLREAGQGNPKMSDIYAMMSNIALNPTEDMLAEAKQAMENAKSDPVNYSMKAAKAQMEEANYHVGLQKEAQNMADVQMLVQTPDLPFAKAIGKARQFRPGMSWDEKTTAYLANMIWPFMRVGANEVFQKLRYMPGAALLDRTTRADFAAGGSRMDIAIARQIYGGALATYGWMMASKMSGSAPTNYKKTQELQAGGYMSNAVKDGNKYVSQSQLSWSINPLDLHNGFMADMAAMRKSWEGATSDGSKGTAMNVALGVAAITRGIIHTTMQQEYADAVGPYLEDSKSSTLASAMAHKVVPAGLNEVAQQQDPYQRETRGDGTFMGRMAATAQSMIPGEREKLPLRYSVYGDPMPHGKNFFGIHNSQQITNDPTEQELQRLSNDPTLKGSPLITPVDQTIIVDDTSKFKPSQVVDADNGKVKLSYAQLEDYQHLAGQYMIKEVKQLMQSRMYQRMTDEDRIAEVQSIMDESKQSAKDDLYGQ